MSIAPGAGDKLNVCDIFAHFFPYSAPHTTCKADTRSPGGSHPRWPPIQYPLSLFSEKTAKPVFHKYVHRMQFPNSYIRLETLYHIFISTADPGNTESIQILNQCSLLDDKVHYSCSYIWRYAHKKGLLCVCIRGIYNHHGSWAPPTI